MSAPIPNTPPIGVPNGKKLVQVTTRGQPTRRFVTASANSTQPEVVDLDGGPTKHSTPQSAQAKNSPAQAMTTTTNAGRAKVASKPATSGVIDMLKETQNTITVGDAGTYTSCP